MRVILLGKLTYLLAFHVNICVYWGRWHYMCAQKVLDSDQLDYYAQDANVLEPFEQARPQPYPYYPCKVVSISSIQHFFFSSYAVLYMIYKCGGLCVACAYRLVMMV